jgi:hypothetical protein
MIIENNRLNSIFILGILTILFATIMTFVCVHDLIQKQNISAQDILPNMASLSLLTSGIFIFGSCPYRVGKNELQNS